MNEVTITNTENILNEIEQAFFDIPFENSQFQTEHFVLNAQLTPERAYRALGLRMHNRFRALREAQFGRMKEEIDIEELQAKINDLNTSTWDKRRAEIDIQQKLAHRPFTDKLINDALAELNVLYAHFRKLPRYTREQFEAGERKHFELSLTRQAQGVTGAIESLSNMQESLALDLCGSKKEIENGQRTG
jgi:hypothetical protein